MRPIERAAITTSRSPNAMPVRDVTRLAGSAMTHVATIHVTSFRTSRTTAGPFDARGISSA
jgi:hypothetical protein